MATGPIVFYNALNTDPSSNFASTKNVLDRTYNYFQFLSSTHTILQLVLPNWGLNWLGVSGHNKRLQSIPWIYKHKYRFFVIVIDTRSSSLPDAVWPTITRSEGYLSFMWMEGRISWGNIEYEWQWQKSKFSKFYYFQNFPTVAHGRGRRSSQWHLRVTGTPRIDFSAQKNIVNLDN